MNNIEQETTIEDHITIMLRDFIFKYEERPELVVLDIGSASALKEELGLSALDELKRYSGMDVAFVMDSDGQTIKFY
jgi:hypothetical protein